MLRTIEMFWMITVAGTAAIVGLCISILVLSKRYSQSKLRRAREWDAGLREQYRQGTISRDVAIHRALLWREQHALLTAEAERKPMNSPTVPADEGGTATPGAE